MTQPSFRLRSRVRALLLTAFASALITGVAIVVPPSSSAQRAKSMHQASQRSRRKHSPRNAPLPLKMIWGPVTLPSGQSAFPTYHQLGVQVFQIDLTWATTAPTKPANPTDPNDPAYQWPTDVDQAIQSAAKYGMRVTLLVKGTPGWANGGKSIAWAPNNPQDYANFLIAAAHRYPTIRLWMVWGEPNRDQSPDFQPMPANSPVGPRRYALILNAGYHALKSVSKSNTVIGGNTWSFGPVEPADFVKWMRLPDGKPPPLDYYGHNPFGLRFPKLSENPYFPGGRDINDIDTLEQQLTRAYHHQVKLWLSEFTIPSDHNSRAFNFHTSRDGQAKWLTAAFKLVDSVNYVAGLGWFDLVDEPPTIPGWLTTGLLTWNLRPKPSFSAYEHAP